MILLLLPLLLVAGCGGRTSVQKAKDLIDIQIKKADKLLGDKYIDDITILKSISFDGKNVVYDNVIDEERTRITVREIMDSPRKDALEINLQLGWATNPDMETVKKMVKMVGGMIYYNYTGSQTGDSFTITIDPED